MNIKMKYKMAIVICILLLIICMVWIAKEATYPAKEQAMHKSIMTAQKADMHSTQTKSEEMIPEKFLRESVMTTPIPPKEVFEVSRGESLSKEQVVLRPPKTALRQRMIKAVEEGNRSAIDEIIDDIDRYAQKEFLSDFISFLKEDNSQVQLLGALALYRIKDERSKEAVIAYLSVRDYKGLEEMAYSGAINDRDYTWQMQASSLLILTLGEIGGEATIPLLESLRGIKDLKLEFGGGPVELALAKLGAVKSLSDVGSDADHRSIARASEAVAEIRDSKKVPQLMATANNEDCAIPVRNSAIRALGEINSDDVPDFLSNIINDDALSVSSRCVAIETAAKAEYKEFEKIFKEHIQPGDMLRGEALCALAIIKPDEYMETIFQVIQNPTESDKFRHILLQKNARLISPELLKEHKEEVYSCLDAVQKDGKPYDKVRTEAWNLIYQLFKEMPTVVLSDRLPKTTKKMRFGIETFLISHDPNFVHLSVAEMEERIDEEIEKIVQIYNEQ